MNIGRKITAIFISAITLALALPNELYSSGSALLGAIVLTPLYIVLYYAEKSSSAGIYTGLFFLLGHTFSSFWLAYFQGYAVFTLGASAAAYFGLGFLTGRLFHAALRTPRRVRPFLFASLWVLWEWVKSTGFTAYPWGTLSMTAHSFLPLIQIADFTGVWGLSFILALCAAALGEICLACMPDRGLCLSRLFRGGSSYGRAVRRFEEKRPLFLLKTNDNARDAVFCAVLFAAACLYGALRLGENISPRKHLKTLIVQHCADSWNDDFEDSVLSAQRLTLEALEKSGEKPDLVVWSESVLRYTFNEHKRFYERFPAKNPFIPFVRALGAPLLTGAPVKSGANEVSNSVILIGADGECAGSYGKMQLVPFAEYIPFIEYDWMKKFMRAVAGFDSSWTPGKSAVVFSVTGADGETAFFSAPICFEDAFPNVCAMHYKAGAEFFVNLTNDSWSKTKSAEMQHYAVAMFRCVEFRATMLRSTNSGYSCVIDPWGRVIADMPLFEPRARFIDVPIYERRESFYARFGDWFLFALAFFCAAGFFWFRRFYIDLR